MSARELSAWCRSTAKCTAWSGRRSGRSRTSSVAMRGVRVLRQACREDIPAMHAVRMAVRENALRSAAVTESSYVPAIEETGRGWVVEVHGEVVAFAVGNKVTGNIWALFVRPEHEGRGYGQRLHEVMLSWLFSQGVERAWLSTDPGTRAQRFYERAGWQYVGVLPSGEAAYEYPYDGAF